MITKLFAPSKSKTLGRGYRLMRVGEEWTTNGFWLIRTKFEPSFIEELKTNSDTQPNLQSLIVEGEGDSVEVKITDRLKDCGNYAAVLLEGNDKRIWVNAYYLSMFMKIKIFWGIKYFSNGSDKLFVKKDDYLIGIIMATRVEDDK